MKLRSALLLLVVAPSVALAAPRGKKRPAPPVVAPDPPPEPVVAPDPVAPPEPAQPKPWADGVPEPTQKQASALYEEGNTLFGAQAHAPALEKYRAAVALWDHPLIQFNLAVTLIRLDRILEAAEHLDKALRYQAAPYKDELYQQALDYQRLVQGRVGTVEVTCGQAGAKVLLDGKRWFNCPGTQKTRAMAGEHTLVGELEGFLTASQPLIVLGGASVTKKVELVPLDNTVRLVYPRRRWVSWTITAAGAAVGLAGVGVWFAGRGQMKTFDENFASECTTIGCAKDLSDNPSLRDQRDGAKLKGAIGITMMVAGGAVLVGGVVMTVMNRPRRVLPNVEVIPAAGGIKAHVGWSF
jgi:hypothetical protein